MPFLMPSQHRLFPVLSPWIAVQLSLLIPLVIGHWWLLRNNLFKSLTARIHNLKPFYPQPGVHFEGQQLNVQNVLVCETLSCLLQ